MTAMMMMMKCVICERTRTRSAACERVAFGVSRARALERRREPRRLR